MLGGWREVTSENSMALAVVDLVTKLSPREVLSKSWDWPGKVETDER